VRRNGAVLCLFALGAVITGYSLADRMRSPHGWVSPLTIFVIGLLAIAITQPGAPPGCDALIFIRWAASELRILAFYKNLALLAAFLGLGLGFARYRREATTRWFERLYLPLLTLVVALIFLLGRTLLSELIVLNPLNVQEFLWAGTLLAQHTSLPAALQMTLLVVILLGLFIFITALFILLGQVTAAKFQPFPPWSVTPSIRPAA